MSDVSHRTGSQDRRAMSHRVAECRMERFRKMFQIWINIYTYSVEAESTFVAESNRLQFCLHDIPVRNSAVCRGAPPRRRPTL